MAKRKTQRNITIFFSILAVLMIAFGITSGFNLFVTQPIAPSDYYLRPSFAYLKCEEMTCNPVTKDLDSQTDINNILTATKFSCQDFIGINEGCRITLQTTNGNLDGFSTIQQLDYYVVPSGTSFIENNAKTLCYNDKSIAQNCGDGSFGYDNSERVTLQLKSTDILWIRFTEGTGSFSSTYKKVNNKMKFIVSGTCFGLIDVNDRNVRTGQLILNAVVGDCLLRDDTYKNVKITSADSIFNLNSQELDWQNLNAPHRVYTYLAGLEPAPFVSGNVQTYNNQFVFCQKANNNLYKIAKISSYGREYQSVILDSSGIVGNVKNCCEGDQRPNQICENDQWKTISESQCDLEIGKFCSEQEWTSYGNLKVRRFSCVDNKCIPEIKEVECNYNENCGSGKVCKRGFSPLDNECVGQGTGNICGDLICTTTEEKDNSCSEDCERNGKEEFNLLIPILIALGGLLIATILIIVRLRRK